MSQENSLNMLDKYFKRGRITQIIGEMTSLKESFISIYTAYKVAKTCTKVIYICSKPTHPEVISH
jgi:ribosomal protein S26